VSKDFNAGRTSAGVIATHLVRRPDDETRDELIAQAFSGGASVTHRIDDYQFIVRASGTHLVGSSGAIDAVSNEVLKRSEALLARDRHREAQLGNLETELDDIRVRLDELRQALAASLPPASGGSLTT